MLQQLIKYAILLPLLFLFQESTVFSQKKKSTKKPKTENPFEGMQLREPLKSDEQLFQGSRITATPIMPEGVTSSKYFVSSGYTDPFFTGGTERDSTSRKLAIEKSFKIELNRQFNVWKSNLLLPFISISILAMFILMKSHFSNRLKNAYENKQILQYAMIGISVAFVGFYIYNGLNDARDKDFEWYIEETWYKGLLLVAIVVGINYLFTRLLFSLKAIENIQKLILWVSLSIGLIFITKYLNSISDNTNFSKAKSFFDFEENISNWLSTFLILSLCAYNLFQKNEWFIKSKTQVPEKEPSSAQIELQKKYNLGQISFEEYNKEWNKL